MTKSKLMQEQQRRCDNNEMSGDEKLSFEAQQNEFREKERVRKQIARSVLTPDQQQVFYTILLHYLL